MIGLLRGGMELLFAPLDHLPEGLALAIVSVITGVFALLVVRATTDQRALAVARDQLASAVLEIRLYLDSPRRVWKAQGRVAVWTARYVARAAPALLVMIVPFTLVFMHMYVRHEVAPLPVGEDVVVRIETTSEDLRVTSARDLELTAPVFHSPGVGWYARVRPRTAGEHDLSIEIAGQVVVKRLHVGEGRLTSPERRSGLAALWALSSEGPVPGIVRGIFVEHPPARRSWLGMPWWLGWVLASTAAAWLLRKPLKVVI